MAGSVMSEQPKEVERLVRPPEPWGQLRRYRKQTSHKAGQSKVVKKPRQGEENQKINLRIWLSLLILIQRWNTEAIFSWNLFSFYGKLHEMRHISKSKTLHYFLVSEWNYKQFQKQGWNLLSVRFHTEEYAEHWNLIWSRPLGIKPAI